MYSAVLMLAVLAGNDSVEHGRNRCNSGCTGIVGCSSGHGGHGHRGGCTVVSHGCTSGCSNSHGCNNSCNRRGLFGGGLFRRGHGCSASHCTGGVIVGGCTGGAVIVPGTKKDMPKGEPVPDPKKGGKQEEVVAPATIVVSLPAEARLFVDGAATTSVSERRTLVTPNLQVGTTYVYTIRAEIVRDGRTVEESQIVNVTGGQVSNVRFNFSQSVASR